MATQKDNLAALADLGITVEASAVEGILPLRGDETAKEVADVLKAAKAVSADAGAGASNQDSVATPAPSGDEVLVWVKGRTYINDKERIDGGFYKLSLPLPDRLAKSSSEVVEVFANDIPPRKLTEIAKKMGVTHPEDFNDKELLAKITVSDFKPF